MARARNIKPGFFTNDELAEVDPLGRLLFAGLWTIADREGRLEDRPKQIKAKILPFDSCNVDELLSALDKHGFIQRYTVDGKAYIQIVKWHKHQNPHVKEAASTIPAPDSAPQEAKEVSVKNSASTVRRMVQEPEIPERAGLIPDSLNLIPDSGFPSEEAPRAQPEPAEEKPRQPKDARASRLPSDWKPSDKDIAYCREQRPELDPERVAENFRDYWHAKAGVDARKADWPATWRTWVRNERSQTSARPASLPPVGGGPNRQEQLELANRAVVARMLAAEGGNPQ